MRVHCAVLNDPPPPPRPAPRGPGRGGGRSQCYGGPGERETPGNIPNPEAKPLSADGTAPATGWESRTPPDNHSRRGPEPHAPAPVFVAPAPVGDFRVRPSPTRYHDVMTSPRRGAGGSSDRRGGPRDGGRGG